MARSGRRAGAIALLAIAFTLAAPSARSETLPEALANAYANNPTLQAARAELRQTDELVPQALSNWRPTLKVEGGIGALSEDRTIDGANDNTDTGGQSSVALNLTQPIYRGGRTVAQRDQAENLVVAGRYRLMAIEQQVLLGAVTAYNDVLRDTAVLELTKNNEQVIAQQLKAVQERFDVGEVTITDVSQAKSRLARAASDRVQAQGNLTASRAAYRQIIGQLPGKLGAPQLPSGLPVDEGEAVTLSEQNPTVIQAQYLERAAQDGTDVVFGELLPFVSLQGEVGNSNQFGFDSDSNTSSATIGAQVTIPLYQAGGVESRVREAKQLRAQRREQLDEARRQAAQDATTAWQALETARSQIESFKAEVEATKVALDGVQQEQQVGLRTVLDVLDAQQEVLSAEVSLVTAQRNQMVAAHQTLAAIGKLTAADLQLDVEFYDPAAHYQEVRDKWFGTDASGQ